MAANKRVYLSPPHVGPRERELLLEAFDSNFIAPVGTHLGAFESELADFLGGDVHCVALSSGTAALHLALHMLGIGRGDRVYVSSMTFVASANAVKYCNAEPVFIDSERSSWNLDPGLFEEALDEAAKRNVLPKAAVVVDLYGHCADYDRIRPICERFGVPLIQDAAEALGAFHGETPAGRQGDFAVFSFNGNKIVTTGGGGMLVARTQSLATQARFLATQARDAAPHYQHSVIGFNYRLCNLNAAVGRGQLESLPERIDRKQAHFEGYRSALADLPGIGFIPFGTYGRPNYWITCVTIDETAAGVGREAVRLALETHNIESRPLWKPMHRQPFYAGAQTHLNGVSDALFATGLCLPSGSCLSDADRERICSIIRECWPS